MKNWQKKLDVVTNIALIVCCVLFLGVLARTYFFGKNQNTNSQAARKTLIGENIKIESIDWSAAPQNLVLVLQKGCRFCEESMPFYQRLVKTIGDQKKTRTIAVMPQNVGESKKYLAEKQVSVSEVFQSPLKDIDVAGTPTLLLVNQEGKVVEQWIGKLPTSDEEKVIQRLIQ